jgi:hypothetical protein
MKLMILAVSILVVLVSGCTTQKTMYDYDTYSESFYGMKKDTGSETSEKWKTTLEEIIIKSNAQTLRVPPGVYANLGYIYLKAHNIEKAIAYFEEEKKTYPESKIFMENLIKKSQNSKVM